MNKNKLMSLLGCDGKIVANFLKLDKSGPFDSGFCNLGQEIGMDLIMDGSFLKAIENRDIVASNPELIGKEIAGGGYSSCFPIVNMGRASFVYPHVSYSSFLRHIDERVEEFKKCLNDPNQVFIITNSHKEKFWCNPSVVKFLNDYGETFKDRFFVVSGFIEPFSNYWLNFDVPVLDTGYFSEVFNKDMDKNEKTKLFKTFFDEFLEKYPQFYDKIDLSDFEKISF